MKPDLIVSPVTPPPGYRFDYVVADETYYARYVRQAPGGRYPEMWVRKDRLGESDGVHADEGWELNIVEKEGGIRVEVLCDAFTAFTDVPELFAALPHTSPTLADVRALLDALGFVDATDRGTPEGYPLTLPPPADDVRAVRSTHGRLYRRWPHDTWSLVGGLGPHMEWWELFADGPLTNATREAAAAGLLPERA